MRRMVTFTAGGRDVSVVVMTAGDMLLEDVQDFVKNVSGFSGRKTRRVPGKDRTTMCQSFLQRNGVHYWGREGVGARDRQPPAGDHLERARQEPHG